MLAYVSSRHTYTDTRTLTPGINLLALRHVAAGAEQPPFTITTTKSVMFSILDTCSGANLLLTSCLALPLPPSPLYRALLLLSFDIDLAPLRFSLSLPSISILLRQRQIQTVPATYNFLVLPADRRLCSLCTPHHTTPHCNPPDFRLAFPRHSYGTLPKATFSVN